MPRLGHQSLGTRWRRRTRGLGDRGRLSFDLLDAGDLAEIPVLGWIGLAIALIGLLVFVGLVLAPLLIALAEVGILLLLAVLGLAARVLFRRPWLIDAHHDDGHGLRWRVVGWRASTAKVAEVRQQLAAGIEAPDAEVLPAPPPNRQPE